MYIIKMKILKILIFPVLITLMFACGEKHPSQEDVFYQEVMEIHDDIMPKMRDINQAKKAIRQLMESNDTLNLDTYIKMLDDADEAMMTWMHDFKRPKSENIQENISYLNNKKIEIIAVRAKMLKAIETAQYLTNQNTSK